MRMLRAIFLFLVIVGVSVALGRAQVITTVAGGGPDDIPALKASLERPVDIIMDSDGGLLILLARGRVVKVDADGILRVVAGTGFIGDYGDGGVAQQAAMNLPGGIAIDGAGNIYIADTFNHRIRMVERATGIIQTVAGTGEQAFSGDGGPAVEAALNMPKDVAVDMNGDIYIADTYNNRIRYVDHLTGIIMTIAGTDEYGLDGDGGPATEAMLLWPSDLTLDPGRNLHIIDQVNTRVRRIDRQSGIITTVMGNGESNFSGDGGPAVDASLDFASGITFDETFNMYVADRGTDRVRRVDATTGIVITVAGNGDDGWGGDGGPATDASFKDPIAVVVNGLGDLLIADLYNERIRKVGSETRIITTVVGSGIGTISEDGYPAVNVQVCPTDVAVDRFSNVYIADTCIHGVWKMDRQTGMIHIVAGSGAEGFDGDGGPATNAKLSFPKAVDVDPEGNILIADTDNLRIRKVNVATGVITTVAGSGTMGFYGNNVSANTARMRYPCDVFAEPDGDFVIADRYNHAVRRVEAATGLIRTIAGTGDAGYNGDGIPATQAYLNQPSRVAVDTEGNVLIADVGNLRIRRVSAATGRISTAAGHAPCGDYDDGVPATETCMATPFGLDVDVSGNIYLTSLFWNRLRRINADTGIIETIAGTGAPGFSGDGGSATHAMLSNPVGIAIDPGGRVIFLADGTGRVRAIVDDLRGITQSRRAVPDRHRGLRDSAHR